MKKLMTFYIVLTLGNVVQAPPKHGPAKASIIIRDQNKEDLKSLIDLLKVKVEKEDKDYKRLLRHTILLLQTVERDSMYDEKLSNNFDTFLSQHFPNLHNRLAIAIEKDCKNNPCETL